LKLKRRLPALSDLHPKDTFLEIIDPGQTPTSSAIPAPKPEIPPGYLLGALETAIPVLTHTISNPSAFGLFFDFYSRPSIRDFIR